MRAYTTFFAIAVMTLGLVFLLLTRGFTDHDAPAARVPPVVATPVAAEAGVDAGPAPVASAPVPDAAPPAPAGPRPMRVVALGRDVAVLTAAVATTATGAPRIEVAREDDDVAFVARLARGGEQDGGADVAVLPVTDFVHAYDRLRALAPEAFAVAAFRRSGGALRGTAGSLLRPLPAGETRIVAAPRAGNDGAFFDPAPLALALFALEIAGVPPTRVRPVAAGTKDAAGAAFSTSLDADPLGAKVLLSFEDAPRLLPVVLVARKATVDARADELRAFASRFHESAARVVEDPGGAARRLETVELGSGVTSRDTALLAALTLYDPSGTTAETGPGSLPSLVGLAFHLLHASGAVAGAPPERTPATDLGPHAPTPAVDRDAGAAAGTLVPVLSHRAADAAAADAAASLLSFVMPRATVRSTAAKGPAGVVVDVLVPR